MILIMENIIELNGSVDERLYAAKLKVLCDGGYEVMQAVLITGQQ